MNELYLVNCECCKSKKPHSVYRISRKRGLKLICCICGNIKKRYNNTQHLVKYEKVKE